MAFRGKSVSSTQLSLKSANEIVAEAWHLTIEHRSRLFHLGIVPSFFSILITGWYLFFQVQYFWNSPVLSRNTDSSGFLNQWSALWNFITQSSSLLAVSIVLLLIVFLGWFFAPMLCRAAVTDLVTKAWRGQPVEGGFRQAFLHFFPVFGATALKRALDPQTFIVEFLLVVRNLPAAATFFLPLLVLFMGVGIICLFFFSLTTQAIIIRNEKFGGAITTSYRLVVSNFSRSLKILFLFLLVELRVIINIILVFLLPLILIGTTGLFASSLAPWVGIVLAIVIILFLLLVAAYLSGILFVFSEAIWTVAFLEFSGETCLAPGLSLENQHLVQSPVPGYSARELSNPPFPRI